MNYKLKNNRVMSFKGFLRTKFFISTLVVLGSCLLFYYAYLSTTLTNNIKDTLKRVAVSCQYIINGDEHKKITNINSREYRNMCNLLTEYRKKAGVYDIYTMVKVDDNHTKFILASYDADSTFMKPYIFTDKMKQAYYGKKVTVTDTYYTDEIGTFYTGYAPLFDSKGKVVALIGVDMNLESIIKMRREVLQVSILLFLVAMSIGIVMTVISSQSINRIVNKLIVDVEKMAGGDFSTRIDTEFFHISEAKELAETFNKMAENICYLIEIMANNSDKLAGKAEDILKLINVANTSQQIIASVVEQTSQIFGDITDTSIDMVNQPSLKKDYNRIINERFESIMNIVEDAENKFNEQKHLANKIELIYQNTQGSDKLAGKYIKDITVTIVSMSEAYDMINRNIISLKLLIDRISKEKQKGLEYNNRLIENFKNINDANKYIMEVMEDQVEALEGIVKEVEELKLMADELHKGLNNSIQI